jgi:outer membrane receptor protein involved in Fe transport
MALVASLPAVSAANRQIPEEIVVSAYRPVAAMELGTSISLLDSETINEFSLSHFEELVQLVPNMYLSGEGSRARYFQIRGIGEREQYEGAPNPSVGYIIDDIDLSGIGGVASTFDLEQVEVLRGPQSARYGASALAGIVYTRTAMPTDQASALVEVTGGNEDIFSAGVAAGGPLTDSLRGRASLYFYEDSGFRDNAFLGRDDTNGRQELTARGKLSWDIGSDWNALLSGLYTDFDNRYDAWSLDNSNMTQSDRRTPAVNVGDPDLNSPEFTNLGQDNQQTTAASLRISGPLGASTDLVSITAVANSDVVFSFDADWANPETFVAAAPPLAGSDYQVYYGSLSLRERDVISQEFRFVSSPEGRLLGNSTDWVVGVFGQRLKETDFQRDPGTYIDFDPFSCPEPGCSGLRVVNSDYAADSLAIFGATETSFDERWQLSLGIRLERWDATYEDRWFDNNLFDIDFEPIAVDGRNRFNPDENMVGGHIALSYAWNEELTAYGRIARGFKAGGFNPSLAAFTSAGVTGPYGSELIPYGPEYLWNYEAGLKGSWLDRSVRWDLSIFYMDRQDAQLSQSDQLDNPASFVYVTSNGDAKSYGMEATLAWSLSAAWRLHGSLGLLESRIDEWVVRPEVEGRNLAHAPPYTLNLGATWSSPSGWNVRTDINAIGAYYFDISHDQKSESYETVNLSIGKQWASWSVSFWGRNIFDENYATRGFYFVNEPPYDPADTKLYTRFGQPRVYGFTASYRY